MLKRTELNQIISELVLERSSYIPHWQDINRHVRPRSAKFLITNGNRGDKKHGTIYNNHATMASRTLEAGMMSGVTSPARPWFRLSTGDKNLDDQFEVKAWLHEVATRMRDVFGKSNLYTELPKVYSNLGDYGTAAMGVDEDDDTIVRFETFPIGSFSISTDEKGRVDTLAREWQMTVRQLVQKFGLTRVSPSVKNMYEEKKYGAWIEVAHLVMRNPQHRPDSLLAPHKKYLSVYFERSGNGKRSDEDVGEGFLRVGGFDTFDAMVPRWDVTGEDPYGNSPAMDALGDIRGLQLKEKRKLQMIEKGANPPLTGPSALRNQRVSQLPGDMTYSDTVQGQEKLRPIYEPNPTWLNALENDIAKDERRISRAYFEDLFMMLSQMEGVQPRNQLEIAERKEEKLLQLGPVMDRLNDELFDPLIDITFAKMVERSRPDWDAGLEGLLPRPPDALKEMQGQKLRVEYTSVMAQAMKQVGLGSIERFAGFVGNLAAADPSVMKAWNLKETIKEYHGALGLAPKILYSDEDIAAAEAAEQAQIQQAQQMEMMKQGSEMVRNVASADMGTDNALTRVVDNLNVGQQSLPL